MQPHHFPVGRAENDSRKPCRKQPSLYLYTDQYSDVKANTISMTGFQANKLLVTLENNLLAMGKIGLITDKKFYFINKVSC